MKISPKTSTKLLGIIFIIPSLVFVVCFGIIPIISSIKYSFTNWDGISAQKFVGFQNYVTALTSDKVNLKAIGNTLWLTLVCTVLNLIIGFSAANFLFKIKGRLAEMAKVILFIPYILSFAAVGVLFSFIFGTTEMGLLNKLLSLVHLAPIPWFGLELTAMPSVIIAYIWKDFGFFLLLYYAGLTSIPVSLLEAAEIDGASDWQKTGYVKIPFLRPITQTLAVLGIINYMLTFTIIMFLTPDGGPNKTTEVVATWFYKQSFNFMEFGYGASLAIILGFVVMILTLCLRRLLKAEEV